MEDIRYLLDENVDPIFRTDLLKRNPKIIIWKIGDPGVPTKGSADTEILEWCEENNFVLITNNRKSMPGHLKDHVAKERHIPGIIELNPKMNMGETIEELILIWTASEITEYRDLIVYLPIT
jgi:hypothetical protein